MRRLLSRFNCGATASLSMCKLHFFPEGLYLGRFSEMTNGTFGPGGQTLPIQISNLCMKLWDSKTSEQEEHQGSLHLTMYEYLYLNMQLLNIKNPTDRSRQALLRQITKIVQMHNEASVHYKDLPERLHTQTTFS